MEEEDENKMPLRVDTTFCLHRRRECTHFAWTKPTHDKVQREYLSDSAIIASHRNPISAIGLVKRLVMNNPKR